MDINYFEHYCQQIELFIEKLKRGEVKHLDVIVLQPYCSELDEHFNKAICKYFFQAFVNGETPKVDTKGFKWLLFLKDYKNVVFNVVFDVWFCPSDKNGAKLIALTYDENPIAGVFSDGVIVAKFGNADICKSIDEYNKDA